ncbi:hypothetical protein AB0O82_27950 [Kitasatospora sp. NPDC088264]|uniref:hypothetical protein n=1 Tax=Kitasatospora sp. NPDC088264 TaxID=3155296 RepID=UPI003418621B
MVLLAALAGGAGGEAGKQVWAGLSALVRRPFQRTDGVPAVSSGEAELAALEQAPDPEHAGALSTALAVRAALDSQFRTGLQQWHEQARVVRTGDGEVTSTISGGTFHAPVLQGRDFSGISFPTASPPPHPASGTGTTASDD